MRIRYFRMYETIKFKECFYAAYEVRARRLYNWFSFLALAVSLISVLVWTISKSMPTLWAIIIAVAQFAQVFSIRLPYADQIGALKFLLPELHNLLLQIDVDWMKIDICNYEETKIIDLVSKYENHFSKIEDQYTIGVLFREIPSILKKAEKDQELYFRSHYTYETQVGCEIKDAGQQTESATEKPENQ